MFRPLLSVSCAFFALMIFSAPCLANSEKAEKTATLQTETTSTTETPAPPSTTPSMQPIMPVKIKPRQAGADEISKAAAEIEQGSESQSVRSLGLYSTQAQGSLGADVWKGLSEADLVSKLQSILQSPNVKFADVTLNQLLKRALLTSLDENALPQQSNTGLDLTADSFAVRLQTLLYMGALKESVDLYEKANDQSLSIQASLVGMQALTAQGDLGVACLEQKAFSSASDRAQLTATEMAVWNDLNSLCQILLKSPTIPQPKQKQFKGDNNKAPDPYEIAAQEKRQRLLAASKKYLDQKKIAMPSSITALNNLSFVDVVTLVSANPNSFPVTTLGDLRSLSLTNLSILMDLLPATSPLYLSTSLVAVEKGLISQQKFIEIFSSFVTLMGATEKPSGFGVWLDILNVAAKLKSLTDPVAKQNELKKIIPFVKKTGAYSLLAFADELTTSDLSSWSADDAKSVIPVLLISEQDSSSYESLLRKAANFESSAPALSSESALNAFIDWLLNPDIKPPTHAENPLKLAQDSVQIPPQIEQNQSLTLERAKLLLIRHFLSTDSQEVLSTELSYDNLFSFTGLNNYVMPDSGLLISLNQASANGQTGEVILKVFQIMAQTPAEQIHPAALRSVLLSLQSVGLNEEMKDLANSILSQSL
jgi:hypothetical protein